MSKKSTLCEAISSFMVGAAILNCKQPSVDEEKKQVKRVQFIRYYPDDDADCLVHFTDDTFMHFSAQQVTINVGSSFEASSMAGLVYLFSLALKEEYVYRATVETRVVNTDNSGSSEDGLVDTDSAHTKHYFKTYDPDKPPIGYKFTDLHGNTDVVCNIHQADPVQNFSESQDGV